MSELDISGISVLIIEDNHFMRGIIEQALKALGVRKITTANDGAQGLEKIDICCPDVIMTDWEMENLDGIEFVKKLRNDKDSPHRFTPIFMVTGYAELGRVTEARNAGVTEYIVKPISARTLYKRLESTIENPRPFVDVVGSYFGPERRRRDHKVPGQDRRAGHAGIEDFDFDDLPENRMDELEETPSQDRAG